MGTGRPSTHYHRTRWLLVALSALPLCGSFIFAPISNAIAGALKQMTSTDQASEQAAASWGGFAKKRKPPPPDKDYNYVERPVKVSTMFCSGREADGAVMYSR